MEKERIRGVLEQVRSGEMDPEQALEQLNQLAFEPVNGFAHLDHHRTLRTGMPEVIFAQGKTPDQVAQIFARLADKSSRVLATRVTGEMAAQISARLPDGTVYHADSRLLVLDRDPGRPRKPGILLLSAGTSDIPVAEEAALTAELMGHAVERIYDVGVAGLHRLLSHLDVLQSARVIIAVAGMEGALASVVGGLVAVPVVAVPTSVGYGSSFQGLAALLAMLNSCASGIAVVNIDNGFGAGVLAAKINGTPEVK